MTTIWATIAPQQTLVGIAFEGVAAEQTMPSQFPEIADALDGRAIEGKTGEIVGGIGGGLAALAVQQQVDLAG